MIIRKMRFEDCAEISIIEKSSFSKPWSYDSFVKELGNNLALYLVAEIEGKIAGYVGVHNICGEAEITMICVDEIMRGRGVASGLFKELIEYEKAEGITNINLEVRESNSAAISLYKKIGFIKNGLRINYYEAPKENAVLMSLNLKEGK